VQPRSAAERRQARNAGGPSSIPILCADDGYEWDIWLGSLGVTDDLSDQRHYLGNALNTTEACCHGFGVALCGNISSSHYLQRGLLIRPFAHAVRTANSLFLITRADIVHKAAASATADWLRALFTPSATDPE
jgi:LysR family glycine cleavage system transcriptional activator